MLRAKSYLCNNKYLFQLIQTDSFLSVANKTSGSKMPRSDWSIVSEYPFILPSLEKQKAIADLLDLIDKDFHLFNLLKYRLNTQKRGLMQKLLTGEWRVNTEQSIE